MFESIIAAVHRDEHEDSVADDAGALHRRLMKFVPGHRRCARSHSECSENSCSDEEGASIDFQKRHVPSFASTYRDSCRQ